MRSAPEAVFPKSQNLLSSVVDLHGASGLQLLSLLVTASYQYSNHDFPSTLLIAWSVAERLINIRWKSAIKSLDNRLGGPTKIDKARKEKLTGRDWTAFVTSESLSLLGRLDDSLLKQAKRVRKSATTLRTV